MNTIAAQICETITSITGIPKSHLRPEFDLIDSGVVDSIQVLQLIDAFEKNFRVSISMDEMMAYTTVAKISTAIECAQSRIMKVTPSLPTHLLGVPAQSMGMANRG